MTRNVHGHRVDVTPCDGLRNHWRVRADCAFVGLISSDTAGYHGVPCSCRPGWPNNQVHQPTAALVIEALLDETVDKA